jgi:tRNA-specific 2-thiouridylase
MYYTIGQRKGLNIGGLHGFKNEPWFVLGKNLKRNVLVVGQGEDNKLLQSNRLIASHVNWICDVPECGDKTYQAKFRYREKDTDVKIKLLDNQQIEVSYEISEGVTPGQIVCLYDKDECIGGAIIEEVYWNDEIRTVFND